jgi:hypothetical protein
MTEDPIQPVIDAINSPTNTHKIHYWFGERETGKTTTKRHLIHKLRSQRKTTIELHTGALLHRLDRKPMVGKDLVIFENFDPENLKQQPLEGYLKTFADREPLHFKEKGQPAKEFTPGTLLIIADGPPPEPISLGLNHRLQVTEFTKEKKPITTAFSKAALKPESRPGALTGEALVAQIGSVTFSIIAPDHPQLREALTILNLDWLDPDRAQSVGIINGKHLTK